MGADLIVTVAAMPRRTDGKPANVFVYNAETHSSEYTAFGAKAVAQIRERIDALDIETALMVAEYVGWDDPSCTPFSGEDMQQIEEAEGTENAEAIYDSTMHDLVKRELHRIVNEMMSPQAYYRDLAYLQVNDQPLLVTGGMSWGDTPTESYDDVAMLAASGVTNFVVEGNFAEPEGVID